MAKKILIGFLAFSVFMAIFSIALSSNRTVITQPSITNNAPAIDSVWLKTKAGRIWKAHQDWSVEACNTIAEKRVHIGMTQEQCRMSWGSPRSQNNTITSRTKETQWCYGQYCGAALYFTNGILRTVQTPNDD